MFFNFLAFDISWCQWDFYTFRLPDREKKDLANILYLEVRYVSENVQFSPVFNPISLVRFLFFSFINFRTDKVDH